MPAFFKFHRLVTFTRQYIEQIKYYESLGRLYDNHTFNVRCTYSSTQNAIYWNTVPINHANITRTEFKEMLSDVCYFNWTHNLSLKMKIPGPHPSLQNHNLWTGLRKSEPVTMHSVDSSGPYNFRTTSQSNKSITCNSNLFLIHLAKILANISPE
jgi:hypothetical protein